MHSTDFNGEPVLIVNRKEAAALHEMLTMPAPTVFKDELAIERKIERFLNETEPRVQESSTNDPPVAA